MTEYIKFRFELNMYISDIDMDDKKKKKKRKRGPIGHVHILAHIYTHKRKEMIKKDTLYNSRHAPMINSQTSPDVPRHECYPKDSKGFKKFQSAKVSQAKHIMHMPASYIHR